MNYERFNIYYYNTIIILGNSIKDQDQQKRSAIKPVEKHCHAIKRKEKIMSGYLAYLQNKKWLQEMKAAKNKNNKNKLEFQEDLEKLLKQKKERK